MLKTFEKSEKKMQSEIGQFYPKETNKILLSPLNDKRYIWNDGIRW